jgi:uncharacterized protein
MGAAMPWIRRGYDPYYDDPYAYRRRWYRPAYPQQSCLRDACLLETGCCIAEGLDGNCLMLAAPALPRFLTALMSVRPSQGMLAAIRTYQREVSAHRPAVCRFTPSCSEYAAQAIERRGAFRGTVLAARRLLRCRPGGARGADPVPA